MKIKYVCLLLAGLLLTLTGCSQPRQDIAQIYVIQGAFNTFREYKIDLENKQLWSSQNIGNDRRDETAPNEGFTFVKDLEQTDIDVFLREADKSNFRGWGDQSKYILSEYLYGHNWGIVVVFADRTEDEFWSTANYPETWDRMYNAFEALTGENVLGRKTDGTV